MPNKHDTSVWYVFSKVTPYAKPYFPLIVVTLLLNLLSTPLILLNPLPLKIVIDSAFGDEPLPGFIHNLFPATQGYGFNQILILAAGMIIGISLLKSLQGLFLWVLQSYVGEKIVLAFRNALFGRIQRLSMVYHDSVGVSDSVYRIQYDAAAIRDLVLNALSPLLTALFTISGMIYIMITIHWKLAFIALSIIPLLSFFTKYSSEKLKENWSWVKASESAAMAVVHESLSSLRVVKSFVMENHEQKRFYKTSQVALKGQLKVALIGGLFDLMVSLLIAAGTALFLYTAAVFVQDGTITVGELVLIMAYLGQLFGPLTSISKQVNYLQSSFASLERVVGLLDEEQDVKENPNAITIERSLGSVEFENVGFHYKKDQPVLKQISFKVKPGQKVGIIGTTGSGKSTVLSLLSRLYDPTSGEIRLDGKNIKSYKISDYRNQFGIVLQEPVLFSTSIYENISYGKSGATREEITQASEAANAHSFITELPNGYETTVGERGMQLSGGERQRISIARAFLKDAPILILDEPTSAVDINTEALIMESMEKLMIGRTSFLVTHRLDTIKECDVIIQMEKGEIKEIIENLNSVGIEKKIKALKQSYHG
ncbi:ABC transporter ATP-binding protein [Pleomorphovibrio marinus]|uniref:ABC transporter ATP-binding protein n=1 Tax=Pleomorphovibrio marinus TaxID=2164132 RepID=UPI000E0A7482|nr:ABC transporter ATP-binding protein [Pleomorphovibrio marinus]